MNPLGLTLVYVVLILSIPIVLKKLFLALVILAQQILPQTMI